MPARSRARAERWLRQAARRIVARARPEKIVLFGSFAHGRPGPDSDMDLLIVLDKPRDRFKRYRLVEDAIGGHLWPLDILVRTQDEIAARLRLGDSFIGAILDRGVVLHES